MWHCRIPKTQGRMLHLVKWVACGAWTSFMVLPTQVFGSKLMLFICPKFLCKWPIYSGTCGKDLYIRELEVCETCKLMKNVFEHVLADFTMFCFLGKQSTMDFNLFCSYQLWNLLNFFNHWVGCPYIHCHLLKKSLIVR